MVERLTILFNENILANERVVSGLPLSSLPSVLTTPRVAIFRCDQTQPWAAIVLHWTRQTLLTLTDWHRALSIIVNIRGPEPGGMCWQHPHHGPVWNLHQTVEQSVRGLHQRVQGGELGGLHVPGPGHGGHGLHLQHRQTSSGGRQSGYNYQREHSTIKKYCKGWVESTRTVLIIEIIIFVVTL